MCQHRIEIRQHSAKFFCLSVLVSLVLMNAAEALGPACKDDAQRLCSASSHEARKACLKAHRTELSAACTAEHAKHKAERGKQAGSGGGNRNCDERCSRKCTSMGHAQVNRTYCLDHCYTSCALGRPGPS